MSAIEERIRKLLALADSPNENEAAAAAEKAQALMLRYGIEMAAVAASGGERLAVDEHVVDAKVDPWRRMLAAAVARSAGGQVVWAPDGYGRGQGKIFFYGPAGAVGGIVELYRYLEAQLVVISAAATAARRERRVHGRTWRNSFLLGAVGRIGQRLEARRAETAEAGENGRALVLVKTAVDREIERRHPELESSSYRPSVARSAYEAGSHAGKHVDLGERRLGRSSPASTRRGSGMSDRQLWLEEPCPTCGARSGLRCQTGRYGGKPSRFLHAARAGGAAPARPVRRSRASCARRRPAGEPPSRTPRVFTRGGGSCSPSRGCGRSSSGGRPPPRWCASRGAAAARAASPR